MAYKFTYFTDPGHGWLAVTWQQARNAGILDKITGCSYISDTGQTIYLEEDCDMNMFLKILTEQGTKFELRCVNTDKDSSIRDKRRYKPCLVCTRL